ncbi:MAG: T9SS type A sorting domain-containing protein [Bacteroidia bacterium]|nr:T9SS type A sorting domain-containing protein [Bacteroidia bacterium]
MKQHYKTQLMNMETILRAGLTISFLLALLFAASLKVAFSQQVMTPVRYYTFNGSNPSADSVSSTSLNFTAYGGTVTHTANGGIVGKYVSLSTAGGLIDGGTLNLDTALTIEFLFRSGSNPGNNINNTTFFRRGDGYFDIQFEYPQFRFRTYHKSNAGSYVSDEMLVVLNGVGRKSYGYYTDGNWHHLVFRFSGTSGKKEIWVDGQCPDGFSKTVTTGYFDNPSGNSKTFWISHMVNYQKILGDLDELAVYNRGIPASLIYKHYLQAQQGLPYSFVNDYTGTIPGASPVTAGIDINEFPIGHPNPTQSATEQLRTYPVPRFKPGHTLYPNFQWIDPHYLASRLQPGVSDATAIQNSLDIQTELARNYNYMLYIGGDGNFNTAWKNLANQNPQWKVGMIILRAQIPTSLWSQNHPNDHYLQNSSGQFLNANGTVQNGKFWRPTAPISSYSSDGTTMKSRVQNAISGLNRQLDLINENAEVFYLYQNNAMALDPVVTAAKNASGLGWQEFLAKKASENQIDYRNTVMSLPQLANTAFTEYRIDGHRDWNFRYEYMRDIMTPINGRKYATSDFYVRWPNNWKTWSGPWHGLKWIVDSRHYEIQAGDKLFSPFVAAGWDANPENDVRPAQWLGLLKLLGIFGAEFFYAGYFNEAASYMPPNPPPNDPKGYAWQAAMPGYAQAVTSRYEDILKDGNILQGDMMNDYVSPTSPGYQFSAGDVRKVVMVRKKDNVNLYAISGTIQPNSNMIGNAEPEGDASISLAGQNLKFKIRRQGSTYIYDNTNTSAPVFYQLDGWHEASHPSRWSADFSIEAELYDNTNTSFNRKTTVPAGTSAGDYRNFTTCITYPDNQTSFTPLEYNFTPRVSQQSTLYFWVRARSRGGQTGMAVSVDNGAAKNIGCISDTNWVWYRLDGCTQQPISFTSLSIANHVLRITPSNNKLEIDKIALVVSANTGFNPQGSACSSGGSATITANGSTSFCQGGSVTLTASAGTSYVWSNGATTQSINVTTSGNYVVTVQNGSSCAGVSSPVTVSVSSAPNATITPNGSTTFCQGQSVMLTASSGSSYLWTPGGQTTQSITVSSAGNYSVRVSNSSGCSATSSPTTVTVNSIPSATISASGATTFCQGGSVTLTASAGSSYLWTPGNQTTQSITVNAGGNYSVRVSNSSGCSATSSPQSITVNTAVVPQISTSGSVNLNPGQSVTLTSSPAVSYSWTPGNAITQSITVNMAGSYRVTTTDANGCQATSAAVNVTVNQLVPVTITSSSATTFCQGDSVILTASPGFTYLWLPGLQTSQSIVVKQGGVYTVQASNGTSAQVTVNVLDRPMAPQITYSYIPNSAYQLTAYEPSAVSYLWSNNSTQQTITVSSAQTLSVRATASSGCVSEPRSITVSNPVSQPCGTPNMLTAYNIIDVAASLAWNPAVTADSFYVYYAKAGQPYQFVKLNGNISFTKINGLTPGTVYHWYVKAFCQSVNPGSAVSSFTTLSGPLSCSSTPVNPLPAIVTESNVKLNWYQTAAQQYKVRFKVINTNVYKIRTLDAVTNPDFVHLGNLLPATTYEWSVQGICNGSPTAWSQTLYFTTLAACPFPGPVLVQDITHKQAMILWDGNSQADSIKIQFGIVGSAVVRYQKVAQAGSTGKTMLRNLQPDTDYWVILRSKCPWGGRSAWSDTLYFHTLTTPVVRIDDPGNDMELNLYPNPARNHVSFAFTAIQDGKYKLRISDMAGRELLTKEGDAWEGENGGSFDVSSFASGIYTVIVEQATMSGRFRLNVQ